MADNVLADFPLQRQRPENEITRLWDALQSYAGKTGEHFQSGMEQNAQGFGDIYERGNVLTGIPRMAFGGMASLGAPVSAALEPLLSPYLTPAMQKMNEYVGAPIERATGYPADLANELALLPLGFLGKGLKHVIPKTASLGDAIGGVIGPDMPLAGAIRRSGPGGPKAPTVWESLGAQYDPNTHGSIMDGYPREFWTTRQKLAAARNDISDLESGLKRVLEKGDKLQAEKIREKLRPLYQKKQELTDQEEYFRRGPDQPAIRGSGPTPKGLGTSLSDLLQDTSGNELNALRDRLNVEAQQVGGVPSTVSRDEALSGLVSQQGDDMANLKSGKPVPEYGISHRPMGDAGGASRLHDLTPAFGDDVYGKNALQYFGSGDAREAKVLQIFKTVRNNPDAEITIYRGVPEGVDGKISKGDWVTLLPEVAKDYGGQVVKMKVKARDITSWPDSLLEFGYFPEK